MQSGQGFFQVIVSLLWDIQTDQHHSAFFCYPHCHYWFFSFFLNFYVPLFHHAILYKYILRFLRTSLPSCLSHFGSYMPPQWLLHKISHFVCFSYASAYLPASLPLQYSLVLSGELNMFGVWPCCLIHTGFATASIASPCHPVVSSQYTT